jgi:hypothetical protein
MAAYFMTDSPSQLLAAFKKAIDDKHVVTWTYDKDGDFTHNTDQWRNKAWFRPAVKSDGLRLSLLKPQNASITWEVYGIYHGRFIESMTVHCHDKFTSSGATATPANDDQV